MTGSRVRMRLIGAALLIVACIVIQTVIVVAHEFTHSTSAWLLGYTSTPFTVIWGNPITIRGWDEGVPYDRLFPTPGNPAEALIGVSPLVMQSALLVGSLYLLLRSSWVAKPLPFFGLYIVAVINLAELVAYIVMRPFIPDGDTGRFNEGLNISPWFLFVLGTTMIAFALWLLARKVGPRIDVVTDGSRVEHRAITWAAGFIIFLWSSGIRMMSLYPDPQWKVGLIGIAGYIVWILFDQKQMPLALHGRTLG